MMKGQKGYLLILKTRLHDARLDSVFKAFGRQLKRWYELYRQRRLLEQLSDDALKDLGLTRADVSQEAERPFWNDPMKR